MKFRNLIKIIILCASIGATALAAEQTNKVESKTLGTELKEYGKIYNNLLYIVRFYTFFKFFTTIKKETIH